MKPTFTLLSLFTCLSLSVTAQRASLPYFDDFESGALGWTPYVDVACGTNWELGTPNTGFTIGAYSGVNCWDVNLNSVYSNYAVCYLSSPIFDFTTVAQAHVSFWTKYYSEYLWDYMSVQYSVDKGDSWEYMPFPNLINPDGYVEKWIKSELHVNNLYGYAAVQFRFVFVSDNSVAYDGYSIDDFRIEIDALGAPEIDAHDHFTIYPNPSDGNVSLNFAAPVNSNGQVAIYDMTGKMIVSQELSLLNENSFNITQLSSGTYSVVYRDDVAVYVKKLVVVN